MGVINNLNFKKYKRFFAFGCSFTKYFWPTWADIIGKEISYYENWGYPGCGNGFILNSVIECNQRHRFNESDLIMVMWSSISREDRYIKDKWIGVGNIERQDIYPEDEIRYVKKIACSRGYYIRDCGYITAVKYLLDGTGCDYDFMSMVPMEYIPESLSDLDKNDVTNLYNDILSLIKPSIFTTIFNQDWKSKTNTKCKYFGNHPYVDYHPLPKYHLEYLNYTYPEVEWDSKTVQFVEEQCNIINELKCVDRENYNYFYFHPKYTRL